MTGMKDLEFVYLFEHTHTVYTFSKLRLNFSLTLHTLGEQVGTEGVIILQCIIQLSQF